MRWRSSSLFGSSTLETPDPVRYERSTETPPVPDVHAFVTQWLTSCADAYDLDADHLAGQPVDDPKRADKFTPEMRRIVAAELRACARDVP